MLLCLCLSSCSPRVDKYIMEFDWKTNTLISSGKNKQVLHTIKEKYETADSLQIAVSYPYPGIIFQLQTSSCASELERELSIILPDTRICQLPKLDRKSVCRGIYYEKRMQNQITERVVLIRLLP